jgi:hypothetical protein
VFISLNQFSRTLWKFFSSNKQAVDESERIALVSMTTLQTQLTWKHSQHDGALPIISFLYIGQILRTSHCLIIQSATCALTPRNSYALPRSGRRPSALTQKLADDEPGRAGDGDDAPAFESFPSTPTSQRSDSSGV